GVIFGTPTTTVEEHTFTVVAKANETTSAEAIFILNVEEGSGTSNPDTITYDEFAIDDAQLNESYNQNIATATGTENILYGLKEGSTLPAGLSLSTDGIISGTPTEFVTDHTFTVVATAMGATSAETTFTLSVKREAETYLFETELTDISDLVGGGISGAPSSPYDMIQYSDNASGDYYLGFTHRKDLTLTYEFISDVASTGELSFRLGTELSTSMVVDPTILEVQVNGVILSFDEFTIPQNQSFSQEFIDVEISDAINIVQGDNVITVRVLENEYLNGGTGSPVYDNITIETDAALSWNPETSNIE
ncbi:MAG: Ig domain-containing protein, partial [Bacillota bacterium]